MADNNIGKPAQRAVSVEIEFAPTVTQTPSPGKYSDYSLIVYLKYWLAKKKTTAMTTSQKLYDQAFMIGHETRQDMRLPCKVLT